MVCSEMHLNVLQRLQEVGAYKREKFRSEEIDTALNKAMYRLLEKGVETNFVSNQINLTDVNALINKNRTFAIYQPVSGNIQYEEHLESGYVIIPAEFYCLTNARVEVVTDPLNCDAAPSITLTDQTEYRTTIPFTQEGSSTFFTNTSLVCTNSALGTLYTSPTSIAAGFNNLLAKHVVIQNIMDTINRVSINNQIYWERYRDTYTKDNFILVTRANPGTTRLISNGITTTGTNVNTIYKVYDRSLIDEATMTVRVSPVRVVKNDQLYHNLTSKFYKTRPEEVIVDQTYDYFVIYEDTNFIVTRFYMDYIRKPRAISLVLHQDCELSPRTHPKVVDLAVEILRLDTKDQSYPVTVQDTQLRT